MAKAVTVYQYEQPRCPEGWNESERRFYARIIETLDDIYSKYGRIDEKLLSSSFVTKVNNAPDVALEKLEDAYSSATVDDLMTKSLTANAARIVELTVEKMIADTVVAGQITAGTLESTFAYMVSLSAKFGSFDFETVQNLVSGAMVLEKGSADSLYIKNLSVLYAQILNATIGSLCIQASDGNYYQIDVTENSDGEAIVNATKVEVNEGEISSGQTESGKVILDTDILAERLTTGTLFATEALTNSLLAAKIDVDTLTARSAFIQKLTSSEAFIDRLVSNTAFIHELTTRKIIGEKSLEMIAGTAEAAQSSADTAQSAADAAKSAADTAQSAAETAQGTADGAMLATAHVGVNPPEAPIPAGRQWLDQGVEPWTLRSWIGADVRTEPEYAQTHSGNPVVLDEGRVLSLDSIRNSFGPVQAGSGDPYPAGGGKNLLPYFSAETKNGITLSVANDGTITLNGTPSADTAFVVNLASALPTGTYTMSLRSNAVNGHVAVWLENTDDWSTIGSVPNGALNNSKSFESTKAYHRAKLVVYTNAGTLSNLQLKIQLERGSTATEYAPYANIRPISGRTGATLTRCGKNLLDLSQGYGYDELKPLNVPVGTSITFSLFPTNGTSQFNGRIIYEDDTKHNFAIIGKNADNNIWHTYTITPEKQIKEYSIYDVDLSNKRTISKGMIEYSSTVTPYEPYQGDTYAADFGQTVYGGTVDWAAGVLAVEWAIKALTGTESVVINNLQYFNAPRFEIEMVVPGIITTQAENINMICSHYEVAANPVKANDVNHSICGWKANSKVYLRDDAYSTVDDYKAYLAAQYAAGTPVQVCYRLAEPVVVQLNLPAVYPLDGTNVLYGGAGALEVDSTASGWRVVNDPAELQSAQEALALQQARMDEALNRLGMAMVLDADGVHVHRPVTNPPCETLTADDSFNVLVNSAIAATFAASYQKMGGQIVVRQTSNGLIFGG